MKTLVIAAALMTAVNSSLMWADGALSFLAGTSEPVGLAMWGLALFAIATSLKKRGSVDATARVETAESASASVREWENRRTTASELTHVA